MMSEMHISEVVKRKQELLKQLEKLGITAEKADEAFTLLNEHLELYNAIFVARNHQFREDAYFIASEINAAQTKHIDRLSAFLRAFAAHILSSSQPMLDLQEVQDILDLIPPMNRPEE